MAQGTTGGLLVRRALVLAKVEAVAGADALPVASLDALQAFDATFTVDPNVLERPILQGDLSQPEHIIGRKLASISFSHELKSNGLFDGQVIASEPKLARLLRGCGYTLSQRTNRSTTFTTDFATNDDITIDAEGGDDHGMQTGDGPIQVYLNGGSFPTGLSAATDYFVIRKSGTALALATSKANAIAGTEVEFTVSDASGDVQINLIPMTRVNSDSTNSATGIPTRIDRGYDTTPAVEHTFTSPVLYQIEVTLGGASATAELLITGNNDAQDDTSSNVPFVVTTDTPFEVAGATGSDLYLNFTFTADLVLGDKWYVMVTPAGMVAQPVSTNFDCLTVYLYEDGLRYRILGSQGTFTVDATAGNFGTIEFTFTGNYTAVIDAVLPTDSVIETTLPQQIELGLLTFGINVGLSVEQWTLDAANNVVPRPDINKFDGFNGVRITDRSPSGGFNPEATLVATEDFWNLFALASSKVFTSRAGTTQGNQIIFYAPRVQTSEIAFGDRDGIRTFEHSMLFKRLNGNDETQFFFT